MSLKYIHILLIGSATLLALAFGVWCFQPTAPGLRPYWPMGVVSFAAGISLVVYGRWFLKKLMNGGSH
jgi:hypothetical protein